VPIRILLIDGHRLFRAGICDLLARHRDLTVVADVGSGEEAIRLFPEHQPDVAVMEVRLPDMNGIDVLRSLRKTAKQAQVLFLTTADDPDMLLAAAEAGAAGYVLKDISPENLVNAIRAVHEGRTMIHPGLARRMLERLEAKAKNPAQSRPHNLKETDVAILGSVASGLSDREIAASLHLSEATVKKHLRKIYSKLGVRNRAQAALRAVQLRLIPTP